MRKIENKNEKFQQSLSLIDHQLQSNVARLLSRENIIVTHCEVPTASFDLKNRVMRLPLWKDFGKVVYDMLIAHEVGHALFDDFPLIEEYLKNKNISGIPAVLNIIDDIRIERRIQDKYPSLPKIFLAAYRVLVEKDIFGIKDTDISKMEFIDRLNIHAKIGKIIDVPLNDEELDFFNRCYASKTTQDVIDLFEEFNKSNKSEKNEKNEENQESDSEEKSEENQSSNEQADSAGDSEENGYDNFDENDSGENSEEAESSGKDSESFDENDSSFLEKSIESGEEENDSSAATNDADPSVGEGGDNSDNFIKSSETQDAFEKNISEETTDADKPWAATKKVEDLTPTVFPLKSTVDSITNSYKKVIESRNKTTTWKESQDDIFQSDYIDYKKQMKKKVGILVREFERRKAAFRYSRSSESRVGTIDVNKMHKYRYDDQIFNTVTNLADGQNHGMILYIDYSGSMNSVLKDVIDQTLNLVHFCKRMSIPFEVYSYTSGTDASPYNSDKPLTYIDQEIDMKDVVLNNIMSSQMSKKDFSIAFEQLYSQYRTRSQGWGYAPSSFLESLGGTPLNSVIMAANHHCNDFQKKHRVDKLNVVILSDGDSHTARTRHGNTNGISIFEGKKVDLSVGYSWVGINGCGRIDCQQERALELLRKKATVIGMYLPDGIQRAKRKIAIAGKNYQKFQKQYTKEKFVNLPNTAGYDSLMILPYDLEINDEDFSKSEFISDGDISGDRKAQTKLAKEFTKTNSKNKKSRVIMTKFAELIS